MSNNVYDIKTGKSVRIEFPDDISVAQWFDFWKRRVKPDGIKTVLLITVNDDGEIMWDLRHDNINHLMQLYIEADEMKEYLKDLIYGPDEDILEVDLD